ncbi:putative ABC transporter ATP-binding protein [Lachnospiraceae bacterium]|nr:putative ABC transporter ATP-binding protein [Lachnospiraceae bacterium]
MIRRILGFLKKEKLAIMIIFLFSLIIPVLSNIIPELNSRIVNAIMLKDFNTIIVLTILLVCAYTGKTFINILMQNKIIKLNLDIVTKLKMEITSNIINQPISFHDNMSSQYMVSRINEVDNFSKLFSTEIFSFLTNLFAAVFALFMIARRSVVLAVIAFLSLPIFWVISKKLFSKMSVQINNSLEASAKANESLHTTLMGTYDIKQFNEEDKLLDKVFGDMRKLASKLALQNATVNKSGNLLSLTTYVVQTLLLGAVALTIAQDKLGVGDYVALGQYFGLLFAPIISVQAINISIKPALVAMKRIDEFVQKEEKKRDKKIKQILEIEICDLSFSYNNQKQVLNDVSFKIQKGEKITITGSNGSGKTTLVKILCGFYPDYNGKVLLNGIEAKEISEKCLRNHIAMLSQKSYLFNTSILENIRMANREVNDEEFTRRIDHWKKIGLLDNLNLEENVIENGKQLSGGQIQRIALARVLHRKADVYIFDEFSNSLDDSTKQLIRDVVDSEFKDKICIFIVHDNLLDDLMTYKYQL